MIYILGRREKESKLLLRGDSEGRLVMWSLPDVNDNKMKLVRQESFHKLPGIYLFILNSFCSILKNSVLVLIRFRKPVLSKLILSKYSSNITAM